MPPENILFLNFFFHLLSRWVFLNISGSAWQGERVCIRAWGAAGLGSNWMEQTEMKMQRREGRQQGDAVPWWALAHGTLRADLGQALLP